MKKSNHSSDHDHFLARLSHLAAFQGSPHWSFDSQRPCSHAAGVKQRGFARYFDSVAQKVRSLKNRIEEERQFRRNIRELRALNDRALRDIGLHRGDIAALASRVQPVVELNQLREELARPVCRVIEFTPAKTTQKPGGRAQLIDNAA